MEHIEKRECIVGRINKSLIEIVRCEDCVHWRQEQWSDGYCAFHSSEKRILNCNPDDFCSGGKRKEQV